MFIMEFYDGEWHNPRIVPFEDMKISPFAIGLHYGQLVFEGMKAYRMEDGSVSIFRIDKHHQRFNRSLERMCMPEVPSDIFRESITKLVEMDRMWIPHAEGASLYIRPFVFASEPRIGVKAADEYIFMVVCSPVNKYYSEPLRVKIETRYNRAMEGGTGMAKCAGNYGASLYPAQKAREAGYDQVIWTDARTNSYIEESGTMNVMFIVDGGILTPMLGGSILDGVTRDSIIALATDRGMQVTEKRISCEELQDLFESGKRIEAFGAGTAAVVAPIKSITIGEKEYPCYTSPDATMYTFLKELQEIRSGATDDRHHWNDIIH